MDLEGFDVIYSVFQDGADFYLENESGDLAVVMTYPRGVSDLDLAQAQKARVWFESIMTAWNVRFVWGR